MSPGECLKCYMDLQLKEMLLFTREIDCIGKHSFISTLPQWEGAGPPDLGKTPRPVLANQAWSGNIPGMPLLVLVLFLFSSHFLAHMGMLKFYNYTDYPNWCVLVFGAMQCNNVLLSNSIFTNKSFIGCSGIQEWKWLCLIKHDIVNK